MRSQALLVLAMACACPAVTPVLAAPRSDSVTACSRFGNGCATAHIRKGRFGYEVQLRSGTWIDCRGDCRETLREETVDFWETQNDKALLIR